ncbi:probable phospholipid hydroperoxide glutathione peroxidase [Contarinia nasturtii]|uniref:probable phospholipid hydroperoxide glutathione peroxidase n=1 Tax=Contarinia nasturtii TaxID=265458 RepID=UPI0012D4485B|nr:probable phospholipid hydroperoxide glutathione peroxidase [Contarinia nasturtii]
MNSKVLLCMASLCLLSCLGEAVPEDPTQAASIYEFTVKDTYHNDVSLETFKGKVVLVVNIASNCGLARNQYAKMMELRNKYHDQGLRILAFPSNQFAGQMPEADGDEIMKHLKDFNMEFDLVMAKGDVNGKSTIPLYVYLKHKQTGIAGSFIKWNFTKFLVDKNGQPVHRYAPTTNPMDIAEKIEELLA